MDYRKIVPECVWDLKATLGEGAFWSGRDQTLYCVDIIQQQIHALRPSDARRQSWDAPQKVGFALATSDPGALLCGLQDGLYRFDLQTRAFTRQLMVEEGDTRTRLNDACVDHKGRCWFGTMDDAEEAPLGSLYLLTGHKGALQASLRDSGYIVTNGPAISPDGKTLYHNHSPRQTVFAFDLHDDGTISRKRVFATLSEGYPDGIAVDSEGCVWVCLYNGRGINHYGPDGRLRGTISFPCQNVTKLAFGGPDLQTVYVTTARKGVPEEQLAREPLTGGVFAFPVDVAGQKQQPVLW